MPEPKTGGAYVTFRSRVDRKMEGHCTIRYIPLKLAIDALRRADIEYASRMLRETTPPAPAVDDHATDERLREPTDTPARAECNPGPEDAGSARAPHTLEDQDGATRGAATS